MNREINFLHSIKLHLFKIQPLNFKTVLRVLLGLTFSYNQVEMVDVEYWWLNETKRSGVYVIQYLVTSTHTHTHTCIYIVNNVYVCLYIHIFWALTLLFKSHSLTVHYSKHFIYFLVFIHSIYILYNTWNVLLHLQRTSGTGLGIATDTYATVFNTTEVFLVFIKIFHAVPNYTLGF